MIGKALCLTGAGAMRAGLLVCAAAVAAATTARAGEAARFDFGAEPDGRQIEAVTLTNGHGVKATVIALGASLQALQVPDRSGRLADVVLGYPTLDGYLKARNYFGATVGRFANRIAGGRFVLDGRTYSLPLNDGPNTLHGGLQGFDKQVWSIVAVTAGPRPSVTLRHVSPDGEEGFPGTLTVTATYSLDERNELTVDYRATTDRPTIVNLSNHSYFNLAGEGSGSVMGQRLTIFADAFTPVDKSLIPTGEIRPVAGTAFDFRRPKAIGRDIRDGREPQLLFGKGYDHNWVISRKPAEHLRLKHDAIRRNCLIASCFRVKSVEPDSGLSSERAEAHPALVARVEDPASGRVLELLSTQPGLQFYSGNGLDGTIVGKSGHTYRQGDALVLEPQLFPNTPNAPAFGSGRLDPGQAYRNVIVYRFSTEPASRRSAPARRRAG